MKIKQVSKACGLSIDTIRYYERIGLVKVDKGEYFKKYSEDTVDTLIAIKKLRFAGLTLAEAKSLVNIDKEICELSPKEFATVSDTINRAILTTETKIKELTESKQLLDNMKTKLQSIKE